MQCNWRSDVVPESVVSDPFSIFLPVLKGRPPPTLASAMEVTQKDVLKYISLSGNRRDFLLFYVCEYWLIVHLQVDSQKYKVIDVVDVNVYWRQYWLIYTTQTHSHSPGHFTVNLDISAQLNFRASSRRRHIREVKFSRTYQLIIFVLLW